MPHTAKLEARVLVFAPTGKDAFLLETLFAKEELPCKACRTTAELIQGLQEGAALAVVSEEALLNVNIQPLIAAVGEQPPWSDFPLLLLTSSGVEETYTGRRLLDLFGQNANITLLERPVRVATLLSAIRSALRARRRQYQVREYLAERQRNEEKLLQTQKLESLGVLAGGVAHDFNNLLQGILGNASLATEILPESYGPVHRLLGEVVRASESAAHLTKQLLAYAGKGRFIIEPLDLSLLIKETSLLVQSSIPRNVELQLELNGNLPYVRGDRTQIQQIAMNLVINAAEAIPEDRHGRVLVKAEVETVDEQHGKELLSGTIRKGTYIALEVQDNGVGMDEATKARIFDPFFTTKFMGRGLGLAAVLGIVGGHQGGLSVESTPGQGTVFRVLFPADETGAVSNPRGISTPAPAAHKGTILVIDDEALVRRIARASLERNGYVVLLADNGREGIQTFRDREHDIAAVLLDFTMPGMNGEEVVKHLKQIRRDVKVILSSGFNESEVVQRFPSDRLAGFIQKPYTSGALVRKISEVLEQA